MKKLTLYVTAALTLFTLLPSQLKAVAVDRPAAAVVARPDEAAQAAALITRLNEINAMDKSALGTSEKKQLRKEVCSINTNLKEVSGGVYLSVGAVIIIILLLILLL